MWKQQKGLEIKLAGESSERDTVGYTESHVYRTEQCYENVSDRQKVIVTTTIALEILLSLN